MTLENVRVAYASLRLATETGQPVDPPRRALVDAIDNFEGATSDMKTCGRELAEYDDHLLVPKFWTVCSMRCSEMFGDWQD